MNPNPAISQLEHRGSASSPGLSMFALRKSLCHLNVLNCGCSGSRKWSHYNFSPAFTTNRDYFWTVNQVLNHRTVSYECQDILPRLPSKMKNPKPRWGKRRKHLTHHPAPPFVNAGPRTSPGSGKEAEKHMHGRHEFSQFQWGNRHIFVNIIP